MNVCMCLYAYSCKVSLQILMTPIFRSVFQVTFLMALFYGLYTWLIHKLFNIRAAILPAGKSLGTLAETALTLSTEHTYFVFMDF